MQKKCAVGKDQHSYKYDVVESTDIVADPDAVMVELVDTAIAILTVLCVLDDM